MQSFCNAKDIFKKIKWQPTDWEKTFTNSTSGGGLISNIYKGLKKLDSRESNNPIQNGYRDKQGIFNWGISNGWEAPIEMLNIPSHEENANPNNLEIPPHFSKNG